MYVFLSAKHQVVLHIDCFIIGCDFNVVLRRDEPHFYLDCHLDTSSDKTFLKKSAAVPLQMIVNMKKCGWLLDMIFFKPKYSQFNMHQINVC